MTLRVLNDIHIGATRSAGTTPASQAALRKHILTNFKELLPVREDLMLLGDLFDTVNVPLTDMLAAFEILADWLAANPEALLFNVAGNHDLPKASTSLSSFQLLGKLLSRQFGDRYVHIEEPMDTSYGYVIPHLANQELFDAALAAVPKSTRLFLHCNVNNHYAAQSDQSLNLSRFVLDSLPVDEVLVAHEHQSRTIGKAIVIGNQIASSVSDWLNCERKQFASVTAKTTALITCADRCAEFEEVNWRNLAHSSSKFIRVIGDAAPEEVSDVLSLINSLRRSTDAFIVSNAVKVASEDVFSGSIESVHAFSVVDALRKYLTAAEMLKLEPYVTTA